jgi:hypothetical protein
MGNVAVETVKNIGKDLKDTAENVVHQASEQAYDAPKAQTVDKDYAVKTAAEHNDLPTIKSVVGVKPKKMASYEHGTDYVPKTGPAVLHEGEKVVPKEKNMASGVMDAIKNIKDTITSTSKEYSDLGKEYAGKGNQLREGPTTPAPTSAAPSKGDRVNPSAKYGDRPGEKRLDSEGNVIPKYHKGTSYVPKTGPAILEKGEAVIPKDKNMDATSAMAGIMGKAKPAKKIHKIVTHKTDDGKMIHTHQHHHPAHHPDETHVSNNIDEAKAHMETMEPQMAAQAPPMPEPGAAQAAPTPGM